MTKKETIIIEDHSSICLLLNVDKNFELPEKYKCICKELNNDL